MLRSFVGRARLALPTGFAPLLSGLRCDERVTTAEYDDDGNEITSKTMVTRYELPNSRCPRWRSPGLATGEDSSSQDRDSRPIAGCSVLGSAPY
jgi:hypothetical protein